MPLGERIALYRRRSGISQEALAQLVGRSEDWLQKVEACRPGYELNQVAAVYQISRILNVPLIDLLSERQRPPSTSNPLDGVDTLRATLSGYEFLYDVADLDVRPTGALRNDLRRAWEIRDEAHYRRSGELCASLIVEAELAARRADGDDLRQVWSILAETYYLAVMIMTKVADHELARVAADRAVWTASRADDPITFALAEMAVTRMSLSSGHPDRAVTMATSAADRIRRDLSGEEYAAIRPILLGGLYLPASISVARQSDATGARELLDEADAAASELQAGPPERTDRRVWFIPANVKMHRVHAAVELGKLGEALEQHESVPFDQMPADRQGRYLIDIAKVYSWRRDTNGVLLNLLDAERIAAEDVRTSPHARRIISDCLRRQRGKPHYRLSELAGRVGVM
jgi:transcriptional regulator with XRE-family HTH domain